ncbi:phosphatidylinositol N-acetylglucosaminyltransferase subunit A [Olea europaea subsp. europaea]|uniref:Phosphatidylinositol N-acetylglucosaminyltransferase subunit A n=1 Tax=Olea europaea subsp. europaea TaxID=158383 RepID=A0A8S0USV4_OLEEU|nr:phosphatidylinositol N-acetylglucosaminyltransferase subunit A [Olea europaea subsp. europaea]
MVPWNKLCFWSTYEKPEARSLRENMAEWGCTGWHGTPCFDFAARGHEIHIFTAPSDRSLVMGVAGVLVRDKGHPLQYEAFHMISQHSPGVFLLVVGSGPCAERHLELGSSVKVLGELDPLELSDFTILLICL